MGDPRQGRAHSKKTNGVADNHDDIPRGKTGARQVAADRVNLVLRPFRLKTNYNSVLPGWLGEVEPLGN
jgi:hypothetical protein